MNTDTKNALLRAAETIRTAINAASDAIDARARDARRNGEGDYYHLLAIVNALDYLAGEFAVEEQDTVRETAENWAYGLSETARAMGQLLDNADRLAREDAEAEAEKERNAAARANECALQTAATEKEAANVR